ncbi:alpha/beta hydrolase fold domain-containing protein [Streptomyces ginkgonis]|uniref:alpha/beta hydrolase fold domain-containing protein n=1 Tax=Streptomyces ginkgonis TaxID=1812259 RepID=UPI002176D3B3|nr:alpha/beta hydrolase [Streptomyces ginkgonis]
MPLDPFLAGKLHLIDGLAWPERPDPEVERRFEEFFRDPAPWSPPALSVEDRLVPGPHGEVPVRVYRPDEGTPGRALLWLHGGGFAAGDLEMPEAHLVAAELAARAGALVVSVGYRLAGNGVRFPVPVDDAVAAWRWLTGGADRPGYRGPVALGGASAGAALALSTALRVRDEAGGTGTGPSGTAPAPVPPAALLLAYPFAHFPVPAPDDATAAQLRDLPAVLRFTTASIEDMVRTYTGRLTALPPAALPGAADLAGLPPAAVLLSELDDLRPSGELLARQLTESGVPVRTYQAAGMLHGHLNRTPALAEVDRSLDFFATALTELS